MKEKTITDRRLVVLFASQTGTAQEVAHDVSRYALKQRFDVEVCSLDDYPIEKLVTEKLVLFIVATCGQGDEPRNMQKFWKFCLRKNLPSDSLSSLLFSVFGLGDSSYEKYNFVGKRLRNRLVQLGGCELCRKGLGDDQHDLGLYGELNPWLDIVFNSIEQLFPLPETLKPMDTNEILEPIIKVNYEKESTLQSDIVCSNKLSGTVSTKIKMNKRITRESHFQDVRHIIFELPPTLRFEPGDVLMLQPENTNEAVGKIIDFFGFDRSKLVSFTLKSLSITRKIVCSVEKLFTCYLDICGRPSRYFFELLSHFTNEEHERERLQEFSSPENLDELIDYIQRPRRVALEVFDDFPGLRHKVPLEYMIDLFSFMAPRAFSICSSLKKHAHEAHICVAIVNYKTKLSVPRTGVCTKWLSGLDKGSSVQCCWIEKGTIVMPKDKSAKMIMIGPGTGVAPFRSFIEERFAEDDKADVGCLVFGNRNIYNDYLFENEWKGYTETGRLSVITAFSRDQEAKIYVQHRLRSSGNAIWELISQGAYIYVCGNSNKMPDDVQEALQDIIHEFGHKSPEDSAEYLKLLRKQKRLVLETW